MPVHGKNLSDEPEPTIQTKSHQPCPTACCPPPMSAMGMGADLARAASKPIDQHLRAGVSSAASLYGHPSLLPAAAVAVAMIFVLLLCCCLRSPSAGAKGSRPSGRSMLPAFDVEGGSSASTASGNAKVLHPSISVAAASGDVNTLREWLADERCVVDAGLAADGTTALHHGARAGLANVVRLLLDHGADCLVVDSDLRTPLHYVASHGHGCDTRVCDGRRSSKLPDLPAAHPLRVRPHAGCASRRCSMQAPTQRARTGRGRHASRSQRLGSTWAACA